MKYIFLGKRKVLWLTISAILTLASVVALVTKEVKLGIDFTGGSVLEVQLNTETTRENLENTLKQVEAAEVVGIVPSQDNIYLIRLKPIEEIVHQELLEVLKNQFGSVTEIQFQSVGPSVSEDLTRKALMAIIIASALITLYLAYVFKGNSKPISPWKFGICALAALLHDTVITLGVFSIITWFTNLEIDSAFVVAILTVMGFSVHDTIVVFDRIRENIQHHKPNNTEEIEQIGETALMQTLGRSINTSLTLVITLIALLVLGGASIQGFVLAMTIGVIVGTYSSIFLATPMLIIWQSRSRL